jgi:hypothetical protein
MMQSPAIHEEKRHLDRRWWVGVALIVLVGAVLRFTGYDFALPYYDHMDEPWLFFQAAYERGLLETWAQPNPSPGLINIYKLAQMTTETITGASSLDQAANIFVVLRLISVVVSLVTLVFVALSGRELAGNSAGWLAAFVWTLIPLVIYHSFIAIAEPWMMLFAAMVFFTALRGLRCASGAWLVFSVWAGLLGFAFKYSMFPFAGIGIAIVLWRLIHDKSRRTYWLWILLLQTVSITGFLAFLIMFQGLGSSITNPSREIAVFFDNPFQRLLDVSSVVHIVNVGFRQIGTNGIVFGVVYATALVILIRKPKSADQVFLWVCMGLFGAFLVLLVPLYLMTPATLERYLFAGDMTLILVGTASLVVVYEFFSTQLKRSQWRTLLMVASATGVFVWLLPLASQAVNDAIVRTRPQTLTDLTVWASNTLISGGVITEGSASRAFSREFGGYMGDYRERLNGIDLLSKSPQEWQREGYEYVELTQYQETQLMQTEEGRAYLAQLQELRRFPPPETSTAWGGLGYVVYQFSHPYLAMDHVFGDTIHLMGCECNLDGFDPGSQVRLRFYWRALHTPNHNYSVFVHVRLLDSDTVIAQIDGTPGSIRRPTRTWALPSETLVSEPFILSIPNDIPQGNYRLLIGVYDPQTGERLAVDGSDSLLLRIITIQ